jgi:hypothetical protein
MVSQFAHVATATVITVCVVRTSSGIPSEVRARDLAGTSHLYVRQVTAS